MKSSSLLKLSLFFLVTTVFITGLIAYSHSRGNSNTENNSTNVEDLFSDDQHTRRYEKQFPVKDGGEIIVDADAGTVKINSWEKSEVSVVVEVDGSDSRAKKYSVEFKQEGNTIYVTCKGKGSFVFQCKYTAHTNSKTKVVLSKLKNTKLHFHSLRHTFAGWLVQNGEQITNSIELITF